MGMGMTSTGDEIWCDGALVSDKRLAERIAMNMKASFDAGIEFAKKKIEEDLRKTLKSLEKTYD